MKRHLLLLTSLPVAYSVYSQAPVITGSWLPQSGDRVYRYELQYKDTTIIQDTGANITWDFTWVQKKQSDPVDSFLFFNPNQVSFNCGNSSTNLVEDNGNYKACYIKNTTGLFLTESKILAADTIIHLVYTDYSKVTLLNKTFRSQWNDTVSLHYNNGKYKSPDSAVHSKSISQYKFDGYGSLALPNDTFDTVVRIYTKDFSIDSTYIPGGGGVYRKNYQSLEMYSWYVPSIPWPVLRIQSVYDLEFDMDHYDTLITSHFATLASEDNTSGSGSLSRNDTNSFDIYISADKIYISSNKPHREQISYSLFDISGRQVTAGSFTTAPGEKYNIPVSEFPQGMYILKLNTEKAYETSQKILIQR